MTTKLVNGKRVNMTGGEVSARNAEISAWDAGADDRLAAEVRAKRNALLAECDGMSIKARELGQEIPIEWYAYRGDLRQVPQQAGFPHNVTWPTKPSE